MESRVHYQIETERDVETGQYRARKAGAGALAKVFYAREIIDNPDAPAREPSQDKRRTILTRNTVAKICRDEEYHHAKDAFEIEFQNLIELSGNDNVVGLRGIERKRPPTFVCCECGEVFQVTLCPQCAEPLRNAEKRVNGAVALQCSKDHIFEDSGNKPNNLIHSKRPCTHGGPCDTINFLFTYCIYLDALHVNLRELVQMLRQPAPAATPFRVHTIAHRERQPEEWLRETFLMRLWCALKAAEALAYVHVHGVLHGDIAPENIMISLPLPLNEHTPQEPVTRLIDFGQARPYEVPRQTVVLRGRHPFMAPEVEVVSDTIENDARLERVVRDDGSEELFLVCTRALAPGDFITDSGRGTYEVLEEDIAFSDTAKRTSWAPPPIPEADGVKGWPVHQQPLAPARPDERRHRLRPLHASSESSDTVVFSLNQAVRIPADVYSFGCVLAWLFTNGSMELLQRLRNAAGVASDEGNIDEMSPKLLRTVADAMPIGGKEAVLQDVRDEVVRIIVRCLVRGNGGYAKGRSLGYDGAASSAALDLRKAYEKLHFYHRLRNQHDSIREHARQDEARGNEELVNSLTEKLAASEQVQHQLKAEILRLQGDLREATDMNTALTGEATLLEKRRDDAITEHKRAIDALNGRCAEMVQRYEDARTEVAEAKKAVEAERVARVASAEEEAKKSAAQLERARTGKLEAEKRSAAAKKELEALQIEHASLIKQSDDARKQLAETGAALGRAEQQIASQSTTIAEQQRRMALFDESKETVRLWVGHVTRSLADMKRQLSLWSGLDAADVEIEVIEDSEFVKTSNDDDVFRRQLTTNLEWLSDLISGLDEQLAHLGRRIPHNESNASEVPRSPGEGVRNTAPSAGPPSRGRQRKQQS